MNTIHLNINLTFNQLLEAVKQLSPTEKRISNNVIWDESIETPLEQQSLVMQRKQDSQENSGNMLDWKIASKTLTP